MRMSCSRASHRIGEPTSFISDGEPPPGGRCARVHQGGPSTMAIASWLRLGRSTLEAGMLPSAAKSLARRLRSNVEAVGLRRDLAVPFEAPRAAIPIEVRPLVER